MVNRIRETLQQPWLVASVAVVATMLAVFFFYTSSRPKSFALTLSAGDTLGRRHGLAELLARDALQKNLHLTLHSTHGSEEALSQVANGSLDAALVQGGLGEVLFNGILSGSTGSGGTVRQVAALAVEPIHLLVRKELVEKDVLSLKGKRLNLSTAGSGTRRLATKLLAFAGLRAGADYQVDSLSYAELETLPSEKLPDAVFTVSLLPSPVASVLIERHGYGLMEIPFGQSLALRDIWIQDARIPAYTYDVSPPVPERDLHTLGTNLLLICHERVPNDAVERLLETLFEAEFASRANLALRSPASQDRLPEFALHGGVTAYLNRDKPLITGDLIDSLENLRSFLVSLAIGGFFFWQWYKRRDTAGFEKYLTDTLRIETEAIALEPRALQFPLRRSLPMTVYPSSQPTLPLGDKSVLPELLTLREALMAMKADVLHKQANSELHNDEVVDSVLENIAQVRAYLDKLIFSARAAGESGVEPETLPDRASGGNAADGA